VSPSDLGRGVSLPKAWHQNCKRSCIRGVCNRGTAAFWVAESWPAIDHFGVPPENGVLAVCLGLPLAMSPIAVARAQTIVSLTFDDGIATQNQIRPVLASHGMHGTFYIIDGFVGANSYYMT